MADFEILCFGETMAMFVAEQPGELDRVEQFGKRIAGADSNVAIGLARLGFTVAWLSRVGDDSLGRFVLDSLTREGLDCRFVEVDAQAPTGFQMKSREVDGADPRVEYFRRGSAASRLGLAHIREEMLGARHLHATGIPPALSASACELSHELMRRMRGKGASLSFDPNLRPSLWPSERRMIAEINALAAHAHWVLPGLEEGRLLSGWQEPADIAAFYLDMGVDAVAIKLGPSGAYYRDAHGEGLVPGVPVATVVDTVGAGDGFRGRGGQRAAGRPAAARRGGARQLDRQPRGTGPRRHGGAAETQPTARPRAPQERLNPPPTRHLLRQEQDKLRRYPTMTMPRLASSRWWYIMPIVFVTYSLAYLDRANYGFAAASGMADDLRITPGLSSLLGALFFLGYFFFQVPGAIYAEKRSVKKLIFVSLILWGGLATLTGMVANVYLLIGIRFLLGVVEAAVMPAMLVYLCHWFTRAERSRANTFLILGNPVTILWMSVVSGYLVEHFSWRWMFIIEGLPAVIWAFIWWRLVDDRPRQAAWLSGSEKRDLEDALAAEQQGIKPVKNYREAFRSPKVIVLSLQYFCWSIGVYGFVLWLPSILKHGANIDIIEAGWLSALPYLAAVIAMLGVSWASDRLQKRKRFVWPPLLIASIAFYGSYALGSEHFWLSYALLVLAGACMYAPYGPFFAIVPEVLPANVAGGAMALINSMGALGSFSGSWLVGYLNGITGGPGASYLFMSGALLLSVLLTVFLNPHADKREPDAARAHASRRAAPAHP
ncbi:putative 2-ketogluconate transporter [Pseudomonas aeruginosa]|nr:putative 2-ketogluconate transporter [Pseudomonas aeruginosa]